MNIIIVGGGYVGTSLADLLLKSGCSVKVIENRRNVYPKLLKELPEENVFFGSGTDPAALEEAGIADADVLVAVTSADETNLVASTIAKYEFGVPRVLARVNNPSNAWMFNPGMGVDTTINQASFMAHLITEDIDMKHMTTLLKLNRGDSSIIQVKADAGPPAAGKPIRDLSLPDQSVIIAIFRGESNIIPGGDTVIEEGDTILAFMNESANPAFEKLFNA